MSKAVVALVGIGLGVGALVLLASPSKASAKGAPASQFGQLDTVQGPSGYIWGVARLLQPGPVAPGVNVFGLFLAKRTGEGFPAGATPEELSKGVGQIVMTYAQRGDDKSSRVLVQRMTDSATDFGFAKQDFGV